MKTKSLIILLFLLATLNACKKDESGKYTVSGRLYSNGTPQASVSVNIDGLEQYKITTDPQGRFSIGNVTEGTHNLNTTKSFPDGTYIRKSFGLDVNGNLNLDKLLLPNPVAILSVTLDSTSNLATIIWNRSHAEDFREYKLYSHHSSGLDETTGALVHVATTAGDTVKSIPLENFKETFFRVFVMNDYGQLGGSNIMSIHSANLNLVAGGGFESQALFNQHWTIATGTVSIIDSVACEGSSCLLMQNTVTPEPFQAGESLVNIAVDFEKDVEYRLSFWYRISGMARMDYHTLYFYYRQEEENHMETNLSFELGSDFWAGEWIPNGPFKDLYDTGWLYYSKIFVTTSAAPARFYIGGQIENIMLDNLAIKVNE